jgi:hypothetical protein
MPNGGTISWQATRPDNSTEVLASVTWDASTGYWNWSDGEQWGDQGDTPIFFLVGAPTNCQSMGSWSIQTQENGSPVISHGFSLSDASPLLAISSPTLNQLFDLDQNNFTETDNVPYNAATDTGNTIIWAATLNYETSGGYGITFLNLPGFATASGEEHDETYQSEGGQVEATASTTASDGSTIQDCVTYYIDGVASPSPLDPTAQLLSLYNGRATPRLMTGIAEEESAYNQFQLPGRGSPAEPDLFNGIQGFWPYESYDGGSHTGLMMFPTSFATAWDWQQNTNSGVNDTTWGFAGSDLPYANRMANWIIPGSKGNAKQEIPAVPAHTPLSPPTGVQLENVALVLYGPYAHRLYWAQQYYIPVCSTGSISSKNNTWTCNGADWYWATNDPNIDSNVTPANIFPQGVSTTYTNADGIGYANDVRSKCSLAGGTC